MKSPLKITQSNITIIATISLFLLLFILGSISFDGFFSLQVFLNLFIDNAYLIIIATGMAFVILTGGIDLSVAALIALITVISADLLKHGVSPYVVIPCVLLIGTLFGWLQGYLITRFQIHPWIVTLGGMFFARGVSYLFSTESIIIVNPVYRAISEYKLNLFGFGYISIGVVIALCVVAIAIYVSRFTTFGRHVYALGGSERSSVLMGLPVKSTKIAVYAISGCCSALSGVVFSFYMLSGYALHVMGGELDAIAACVIGGILLTGGAGFLIGPMIGVLSSGVIQTMITFQGTLNSWWTKIVIGVLLFGFIALQKIIVTRQGRSTKKILHKNTDSQTIPLQV